MRKKIFFCGVSVTVILTQITEKEIPYYIRERLDNSHSYIQKKKRTGINWYYLKTITDDGHIHFFWGELPIDDTRTNCA